MTFSIFLFLVHITSVAVGILLMYKLKLHHEDRLSKMMIYHSIYLAVLATPGISLMMLAGLLMEWRHVNKDAP